MSSLGSAGLDLLEKLYTEANQLFMERNSLRLALAGRPNQISRRWGADAGTFQRRVRYLGEDIQRLEARIAALLDTERREAGPERGAA